MTLIEESIISTIYDNDLLVERFRSGDQAVLDELVRRLEGPLMRVAYRIVGQVADAEEVRQTVLLRMLEAPQKIPKTADFIAWIHRCTVNEALTMIRRRRRTKRIVKSLPADDVKMAIDPLQSVAFSDEVERMRDALETLEPEQRALLALRFDEGLTIRHIASVMEKPHTTVQSQLTKAIDELRNLLSLPNQ